ncbi:uncharacterized protein LOC119629242 [Bombyx mori]|uniref:FP protein C-terminal domain-containing protein n=1 Tax=Bombyx mori TaxID=7091 RepID=A0A8R2QVY6_BOMMO|nr:uncharacterized protein LOC119629242 [Bombyx mori]
MHTCANCGTQHTDGTICSICKNHYDFPCSGVTESGYRRLGERKNTWRCLKCKGPQDSIQEQLSQILSRLAPLATVVDDIKSIKAEIGDLKNSLELAYQLTGDLSSTVKDLGSRICTVEKIGSEVPALRDEITRLNNELQDRDQWARANNVEIRGIPEKKGENLYDVVSCIGQLYNISIKKEEINYIARIPTRVLKAEKSIIVAFNNRYRKEELIALARKIKKNSLSDLGIQGEGSFYLNDHLTQRNKTLLNKAKSLAKDNNFQYIWVKHCKIMARKSDTSPIFFIKEERDLKKIT